MKKQLALILVFALLLPVLAGCQSAYAAANTPITPENALDIALEDADVNNQDVRDVEVEREKDHIEVEFEKSGKEYEYKIDAETGEILNEKPPVTPEKPAEKPTEKPAAKITKEEAINLALAHAGLTKEQVRDLDVERDKERGTLYYEVDFESCTYEYEYEIHAETGEILKAEKERD